VLQLGVLLVNQAPAPWQAVVDRLRPFIARRVPAADVEDVIQEVFLRVQRGLTGLRDDQRFDAWLFQVARSAVAEHGRARARHPLAAAEPAEPVAEPVAEDDREVSRALSGCVASWVARLPSPYREAVTLVELQGLTAAEAAELSGISVSGMKSRVQRGRARMREMAEDCCEISLDARGKVIDVQLRDVSRRRPADG